MPEHYKFQISFPNIDFDKAILGFNQSLTSLKAELICAENDIELRIYYSSNTDFGRKFSLWASSINWRTFGSFIRIQNENQNYGLERIALNDSELLRIQTGSQQIIGDLSYVIAKINTVKFYWISNPELINTAEFYLNDLGFNLVKDYYSVLFGLEEEFNISRMNGMDNYYTIGASEFRPEFNFWLRDSRDDSVATIVKEPKIQFRYKSNITEEAALKYADLIRILASFYFHSPIDFITSKLYLPDNTITIQKTQKQTNFSSTGNLWGFKNFWSFHELLNSTWQENSIKNYAIIKKVTDLFIHSLSVHNTSKYLILYNIVEIIKGKDSQIKSKFSLKGTESDRKIKYQEALNMLLETIEESERDDFRNKWQGVSSKLLFKPMKSPILEFLKKSKFDPVSFPLDLKKLIDLRDDIIHGSTENLEHETLEKANWRFHSNRPHLIG